MASPVPQAGHAVAPSATLPGGERAAATRLRHFLRHGLPRYADDRGDPCVDATSRLSAYLHFGNVAIQDVLLAARTVVLATASAYTGALLSGWYAAHVLLVLGDLEIASRRDLAVTAGAALLCTIFLAVVGLVVERWCEVPPPADGDGGASATSGSTA